MPLFLIKGDRLMAIDFSDVAKPIDEKQLPNQAQAGLVDFSDVAKPIDTNESRNANQWSPANGTIFDQIDQQKLMYDPNLPDATIGRVFMAGVKDAFEGYAGGSAMEAAESRNIMGMTPEQIKAHLGEGARNSLMGDYALAKMENIDNNYIKNKEGIKAGIRDVIVDKATALAKMADPGDYNLPTSFLGQLVHDTWRSTPYSLMSAVPSIVTGALTGGAALPTLIVSFLTSMGEASSEGGRTYISMIEAGKSHDEAYAAASKNKDFNTLMLTLSNMISGQLFGSVPRGIDEVNLAKLKGTPLSELSRAGQVMGKAMERPIISNIAKSPIKRGLVSLGSEFVMEGAEEMGQSVSDAVVRGEKINVPNLLYEGLVGGLSGAGQSSVGTAIDYAKNRGARAKYKKLAELMEIMKEKDTPEGGNNKVVAEAISQFKDHEHNVMFDALNERNRILALPLEDRSALEEQALPVLSEAVNLFAQGKVEEGLSLLAEKNVNFDFGEEQPTQAQITRPQGPTRDVTMHPDETIGAIGEGPQLQEVARAEFDRLRSIPEDQRTAKDNQQLEMYRNIMEAYTAGNNVAGDLGTVAQRTVAGQPINLGSQQVRPIIPGRSFNNAQLAMVEQGTPMDRTYVGAPKPVNGGFVVNKPDGNAVFVPQAEMGGYYQVGNEQPQAQIPTTPQPAQTQPIPKSKKQQKPAPVPQVRDGVGTNDIYQGGDGVAYWVRGFDANNKIVMADNTGSILRVTPEQLGQNFQRLSPARREQVSLSAPVRSEVPSLADQQKAAGKEQAAQQKQQTATTQKQAGRAAMPRTPEVAKAAAKARTEKQAKPTTEKTNTSTPAQTTTEQEQMARAETPQTTSESTTTKEVIKEDKVSKGAKKPQESTVKVGEKYKNKTGQTVIVKSVEDGNVSFDLETPGIMKPSPRSIEKFIENYKKIDDDTEYKVEPETEERTKRTVTAKDISSAVKGAKVRETKDGIISIQFKNGFVLNVDPNSDEIVINPEIVKRDYGRDPNSGDKIIGSATMVGNEGFIRLISGMSDLKTFNHELYHIAEKMVLTKEQIAIVKRAYGGSEERANAFADVAFKRKQAKNKLVTSLFQKIADFFADIRASIFGERAEDIFRSVSEGKVWGQKLKDATRDESYKIANKAKSTTDKLSLDDPALTEREKELLVKIDEYYDWEPSRTKDGKILGAPEWVKDDKDLKKLRKLLRQLVDEGVSARFWYGDSGLEVLRMVGGNVEDAAMFTQILAIYSPKNKVDNNTTAAIKAWNMYKRGVPESEFHVGTSVQDQKAKNVLYHGDKWEGRKTGSFYSNLMFEILKDNPELAESLGIDTDKLKATIDLWMYRAFGYINEQGSNDQKYGRYTFAESSIIRIAAELNRERKPGDPIWTPHQVQAAIWTAIKTRYENETVKEKTNALGVKQGLITYKDGKPVYPRDGSRAQKAHYANWRKFALAIPDSDSVRAEAELTGVSFAEYIKRMTQHVTLEVIPSSKLNEDINGASEATKRAFTERALAEIILDKDGNDQIAQLLGVPLSRTMTSDGAYDGGLNPNIITSLVPDKVREFDSNGNPKTTLAFNYDTARAYARIIQYIFKQDGVPWFTPNFVPLSKSATDKQRFRVVTGPKEKRRTIKVFDTLKEANKFLSKKNNDAYYVIGGENAQAVMLTFSDDLTSQKLVNLLKLLETKFGKSAGFTRMSNREVAIVNFRDDETKVPSLDDEVFFNALTDIKEDLHSLGVKDVEQFYAKGEYGYVHNWEEDNTGSAILDSDILRGRPDIQERVRVWRDLFEQLLEEYSGDSLRDKERAYVDRGTIRGSGNKTSERDIGPDAESQTGEVKPQYPFKVEPDGSVRLFHWSNISGLTTLDPAMHGTGISGAEAKRKGNNEENYVNRLYFGVNEGGYEKEARLGNSKYEVSVPLDKLYDMAGDPSKYLEKAYEEVGPYAHDDALTLFEKMVKEAGYLGMWKDVGYKKHSVVAMLFTPTEAKSIAYSNQSNDAPNEGYRIAGEESDSTFKAPPVTLRAIKRAVPGAKVSITKDGLVSIQFKNGFVVNVNLSAKSIKIDQDVMKRDYGREATAGDIAVGRNYVTVDGEAFIDIVSGMTDMRTFHHELYEVARRMALSGQQLDILDKAFKGNKEAEAEAYADFMVKRLANQSKLVNSLFQKISDFFSDIRAKLFGQNSEDIFRQIGDGKVAMGSNTVNNEAYRIADKLKALDKQYMDAVENGDMETAQRLVNEAAELAGLPILDDSATVAYKVRRGPAPSKTEKAYKLFSTKKSRGGELFPLFVGANDAIPQGVWLDAMEGPSAGESKTGKPQVKSKLGNLSFRPGWHTSDMPIASHIGVKDANGDIVARRANEVWAEVEVSADVDYQTEAGDKDIKHMPTDGMYRYKTNPNMPGKWIISGSMKVNRVLTENEVNQILEDNGIDPMVWEDGELLLERLGLSPEAVSNTGKLADPVTYDDNGRVIPLSERFNPDISDPRYRIVGMGGQKFSSPAEVTMVTPADKQVAKQKVANLQYVPAPQTTWKTDSGRNKKDQAAWHALTDGLESVVEKREPRMTLKERIVHVKDWFVDNWIDNLSIIQRTADEKLYRHARGKVDGISSRAEKLIKFGDKKRGVEGLTQIFKGMSDEEFKGFLHYAEYKNIIDIINNSEEAMRSIAKAYDEIASEKARLKELRSTKPLDADDAKQLARGIRGTVRYIEQLQKDIDHSLEYVREVRGKADQYLTTVMKMEKLYPDWVERQQKLTKYTNNLLRINRDSGMISANLYRFLTETRPNYLPALRDFSDEEGKVGLDSFIETRGFVNLKSPLRRMHGSKRDIVNPIDEIIANTFRTMSLEAKQSVATSFIDFYESRKDGDEYLWRTKPDKAIEEGHFVFFVRRDGEKHYYATDSPALYEALTLRSTSKINLGSVGKPAELITKMLRQATTRAVRFIIRNPERDNFQAAIYGEGFIPFVTAFGGGIQVVGGGEWFERFLEAGGAQGISTVDKNRQEDIKSDIMGKKFFRHKGPLGLLRNVWDLLGRLAEVSELSTRVGQFKKAIELGYTDEEAAYIARDLMNFGIGGSDAKQMNRYIPFLTASIQDMNRFYRGHSKKNIAKTVRRAMMYITIPTLALWFWNNGDDDRKEYWDKLATWEKNAFWWIILNKDTAIPVAKPFLLGLVYGSLPERFMDYWLNNDRRAVEDFGKTLLAQTMPGYMPLALQLVMELGLNKSFFYGREIVPANEQKLEGKLQYGPYTAEWAKALGSISGISPRKLEYAVFGVTGSLGKEISAVVDDVWRSVSGTTRPDKYITEYIPGSTAWISHGRNHMGPLYAWNLAFPALEEAYRSAKKVYEVDGADSLSDRQRLLLTYEGDVKAILKLNTAKDGIWKLQGLKNKVVVDKNMTAEQKRKAVDEINARIILLAQVGLKKLDFFQDAIDSMEDKMEARR